VLLRVVVLWSVCIVECGFCVVECCGVFWCVVECVECCGVLWSDLIFI